MTDQMWRPNVEVYHCPLAPECAWMLQPDDPAIDPSVVLTHGAFERAMVRHVQHLDAQLLTHLETHSLVQFVAKIAELRREITTGPKPVDICPNCQHNVQYCTSTCPAANPSILKLGGSS